ncbi:hypothetical protein AHAS_Ahas09G0021400 [Arachis hypogaea]
MEEMHVETGKNGEDMDAEVGRVCEKGDDRVKAPMRSFAETVKTGQRGPKGNLENMDIEADEGAQGNMEESEEEDDADDITIR